MEEKWKQSKKLEIGSSSSSHHSYSSKSTSFFSRSSSTRSSSSKAPLLRSLSQKQAPATGSGGKCPSDLPRSCSQKNPSSSIGHKCSSLAKEQKARFYIMRRCVAMLVCWHKHGDT